MAQPRSCRFLTRPCADNPSLKICFRSTALRRMQSEKIGNISQAGSVGFIGKLGGTEQIVRRNRSEEIAGVLPVLNISFYGAAKVLWN
jgi:hypothetical protein